MAAVRISIRKEDFSDMRCDESTVNDDSLFVDEKIGQRLERRHISIRNGCPCHGNQFFGRVEPRG